MPGRRQVNDGQPAVAEEYVEYPFAPRVGLFKNQRSVTAVIGSAVCHQIRERNKAIEIWSAKESGCVNGSKNSAHFVPLLWGVDLTLGEVSLCRYWHAFRVPTAIGGPQRA